ncbi:hypothetical protein ADK52_24710 [Streptomyces sp. WM6372]|nr:hypothetical protein ADK52_24710 [Streptomyces sp. WM6372]
MICAVLTSCVALGGVAALAPPTAAAAPAASCTVTPAPNGMSVIITGEGFTPPRNLNDGESTEPLNIDADGNFRVQRFQKNVDYTVLAVNEDQQFVFVNCKVGPAGTPPAPQSPKKDFEQGYAAGFSAGRQAGKTDCAGKPPEPDQSQTRSDAYVKGWTAGADNGFKITCANR